MTRALRRRLVGGERLIGVAAPPGIAVLSLSSSNDSVKGFLALAKRHIPTKEKHQEVWAVLKSVLNGTKYPTSASVIVSS